MPLNGRPRKPTRVLEMSGSLAKNPGRRRARENEPTSPLGFGAPPPEFLLKSPEVGYQRAERLLREWEELKLEGPHICYGSRGTVISLCILKADIRRLPEGSKRLAPLLNTEDKLRSSLGLTEVTRSKVNGSANPNGKQPGSTLASLAQEARGNRRA
jgi:hypothetical protein